MPDELREQYRAAVNKIPEGWSQTTYWTCNDSSSALADVSGLESGLLSDQDETCDPSPDMILGSDAI